MGPCVSRRSLENGGPHVARVDGQDRVRDQGRCPLGAPCRLNDENSRGTVHNVRADTVADEGFLTGKRFLLHDRDPLFCEAFRETLAAAGVETVRLPMRPPKRDSPATVSPSGRIRLDVIARCSC